ncbi:MAG TPA: TrkA family potassium uptake protein [Amaricoccus sp.]|uniref:potassium channel family protein n=1 Tax=Amaricoccus sp. TaxID=1872485 RepID=UPI002B62C8F6|nr:TrkA family potassium uptake protein [Amaricoccus sp.]HMQ95220.1 TrkA family potassium uptake protein [Amaricoccus sp.]HMR51092.1 TrkA family potassium uptake protein [Amaricoccus sp.]HMR61089.1 TrkA family potassium uptake protein [Amaricoccus sp.]HMU00369.1 TrkA family potassium uptake protein [Amaricoccus sp.]
MADRARSFAVIGLGSFGSTVAAELARLDGYVLGIDSDPARVGHIADEIAEAKILDASDEDALREAGLDRFGAVVVAIGENVEASILSTMNARLIGCDIIWAKARDRTHHRILSKLGADRVIRPEQDYGRHVAQMLHNPAVRDYVSIGNGYLVVDFQVPAKFDGRSVGSLSLEDAFGLRLLGVMRGTEFCGTAPDFALRTGDKMLVLGTRPDLRRLGATF